MTKIYVVGIGPGKKEDMTYRAYEALEKSDVIIGYKTYVDLIKEYFNEKELINSPMKKEVDRCMEVVEIAKSGKTVSLISSGDAGVYGMAGIMLEVVPEDIEVEIIPGITAGNAAATPASVAAVDATLLAVSEAATAQITAAIIVTAICCPILVSWLHKLEDKRRAAK